MMSMRIWVRHCERLSWSVRLARNKDELDSINRLTQDLLNLEQDFLVYLNESDIEDVYVGHEVTEI